MEISKYVTLEQLWFLYRMILFTSFFKILQSIRNDTVASTMFQSIPVSFIYIFLRTHFDKTTKRLEKELSDGDFEELSIKKIQCQRFAKKMISSGIHEFLDLNCI